MPASSEARRESEGRARGSYYYLCDLDVSHLFPAPLTGLGESPNIAMGCGLLQWKAQASKSEKVYTAVQSWVCDLTPLSQSPRLGQR